LQAKVRSLFKEVRQGGLLTQVIRRSVVIRRTTNRSYAKRLHIKVNRK
jgi:hypothetical protein